MTGHKKWSEIKHRRNERMTLDERNQAEIITTILDQCLAEGWALETPEEVVAMLIEKGAIAFVEDCNQCNGKGYKNPTNRNNCNGTGKVVVKDE